MATAFQGVIDVDRYLDSLPLKAITLMNTRKTVIASLDYDPQPLKFGTSGRRGEVIHLTQLEISINALAELEYLQSLPRSEGGIRCGDEFFFACDLRPSSSRFVPEEQGRGEIAQAIERAIRDAGMHPVNLGMIPTPALTSYAIEHSCGSMMITGSHIPFDRNGYKTNTSRGELLKTHEAPINARVEQVRQRLYQQPFTDSPFNEQGRLKCGHQDLSPVDDRGREAYIRRYVDFFGGRTLAGQRILAYQHSAVGRDILCDILRDLGAEVIPVGRSEAFVPIDTENIDAAQLAVIQELVDAAAHGSIDAVVSTDGDSDRPLILGVEPSGQVRFFGGDLVGMVVAEYLGADAVVAPISSNDGIDRGPLKDIVEPKTRIGSPFVIAGMEKARGKGRRAVCGWEANGGFLTGSDIAKDSRILRALPTRDAILPILGVLFSMVEKGLSLSGLFDLLPKRFSRAALLKRFPRPVSLWILDRFSPTNPAVKDVIFSGKTVTTFDEDRNILTGTDQQTKALIAIRNALADFFAPSMGFGAIHRINTIDGVRIYFDNGDVAQFRPSGNADELRIYAVADTQSRADAITEMGIAEPEGILRRLEKAVLMG